MTTQAKRIAGVLGGMGPDATVDFMAKVIALTPADTDQDHVRMLVDHNPQVPSRQVNTPRQKASVERVLADMALGLQRSGADFLVMPCNTAHAFIDTAVAEVSIPVVHIVTATVRHVAATHAGATAIGLLATDACLYAGLYQAQISERGLSIVLPEAAGQAELMSLVFRIKQGDRGREVTESMTSLARRLIQQGADVIVAGCTEIPLVLVDKAISVPLVSSTDVLALRTVELCLGRVALPGK